LVQIQREERELRDKWRKEHKDLETETTDFEKRKDIVDTKIADKEVEIKNHIAVTAVAAATKDVATLNKAQDTKLAGGELDFGDADEPVQVAYAQTHPIASKVEDAGINAPQMAAAFKTAFVADFTVQALGESILRRLARKPF
jgi:hypothetical protein